MSRGLWYVRYLVERDGEYRREEAVCLFRATARLYCWLLEHCFSHISNVECYER